MQLTFKKKMSLRLDNFDVFDEKGNIYFIVKGQFDKFARHFFIYDNNNLLGELKEEKTFLPSFTMIKNGQNIGTIKKEKYSFKPKFTLSKLSWVIEGDFKDRQYIISNNNQIVASINKKIFSALDTYYLDITNEEDSLKVLMVVLAIETIKLNWQMYYAIYTTNT